MFVVAYLPNATLLTTKTKSVGLQHSLSTKVGHYHNLYPLPAARILLEESCHLTKKKKQRVKGDETKETLKQAIFHTVNP